MTPRRRGRHGARLWWLLAPAIGACVPLPSPPSLASVAIRNQDTSSVTVRWAGPSGSGEAAVDACDTYEVDLTTGQYAFDVRSRVDQVSLPVAIDPSDLGVATVIGITPDGQIGFGAPPPNPSCANN